MSQTLIRYYVFVLREYFNENAMWRLRWSAFCNKIIGTCERDDEPLAEQKWHMALTSPDKCRHHSDVTLVTNAEAISQSKSRYFIIYFTLWPASNMTFSFHILTTIWICHENILLTPSYPYFFRLRLIDNFYNWLSHHFIKV